MTTTSKMMGFSTPGDQRVPVSVRDWNGMKLALWRSKVGWEIAAREAAAIIDRCEHAEGCIGKDFETEPCLVNCPDREQRMSALVVLNAARMFAPIDARRLANEPYMAPSREYFSEVIASFAIAQAELEALRAMGIEAPTPPQNTEPAALPAQRASPQLIEYEQEQESPDGLYDEIDPAQQEIPPT